jgi:hypothetical protein
MMGRVLGGIGSAKRERVTGCKPFCMTVLRKFTPELAVENTFVDSMISSRQSRSSPLMDKPSGI